MFEEECKRERNRIPSSGKLLPVSCFITSTSPIHPGWPALRTGFHCLVVQFRTSRSHMGHEGRFHHVKQKAKMSQFQRSIETTQRDLSFPAHHSSIEDLQLKRQRLKVCCESGARKRESGVQTPTSHPTVDKGMKKDSRWHPSWIHPR